MMKLSIITINLNNVAGLRQTIESVVKQSFNDFEYIIIDGGSTDGSKELIGSFSDRIYFWLSEPDSGIYQAMNKAIKQARGEYLLFLNSGDYLVSSEVLASVFEIGFTEDIVIGECNISQNQKVMFHAVPPNSITLQAFIGQTIPHQSAFIRLDLFERLGHYQEKYRIHSDLEFFIRALIVNNCTYRHVPVTISNYNLEGLSSDSKNRSFSEEECNTILNSLIPLRVLKDYEFWELQKKEMDILHWVISKPVLYKPLTWIYFTASTIVKYKKKLK